MFISLEGIDKAGKTTQLKLLTTWFNHYGYDVVAVRDPGGTLAGDAIRNILLHRDYSISQKTEFLLFQASRAQLVDEVIKPALNSGKVVISDRFIDSTTVYQGYCSGIDMNIITALNKFVGEDVIPDLTFVIDIPVEIFVKRSKGGMLDQIEQTYKDRLHTIRKYYKELAKQYPVRIKIIDGTGSPAETFKKLIPYIERYLDTRA